MPMWDYLKSFDHYKPVIELGAARFAKTSAELAEHVNAFLENPGLDKAGRKSFVDLEIGVPVGEASQRIMDVLLKIAKKR
jgi:hypothetical protein